MPDKSSPLIDAAVRPFHDNAEQQMAARNVLGELARADGDGAAAAIRRWDRVDAGRGGKWRGVALWLAVLAAAAAVLTRDFHEIGRYVAWALASPPTRDEAVLEKMSPGERRLFSDGEGGTEASAKMETLWRSEPGNAAFFSEYAVTTVDGTGKLPPDFLETARRIDPDNAWFTYLAAAEEGKKSVEKAKVKAPAKAGTKGTKWKVLDQARVDRAMEWCSEAGCQRDFNAYSAEMLRRRLALLPTGSLMERIDALGVVASQALGFTMRLHVLASVLSAQASISAEAGDVEGFQRADESARRLLWHVTNGEVNTLLDEVVTRGLASSLAKSLAENAEKLELADQAAHWSEISKKITAERAAGWSRKVVVDGKIAKPKLIGGGLFGNSLATGARVVAKMPPLTDADLAPGRMMDHEILSRFCTYAAWLAMGGCALAVAAYRFRVSKTARRLAGRVAELLDARDAGWIAGVGIVLPLVYVAAVNRWTPLGGRQFGMLGDVMLLPAGHFTGLLRCG